MISLSAGITKSIIALNDCVPCFKATTLTNAASLDACYLIDCRMRCDGTSIAWCDVKMWKKEKAMQTNIKYVYFPIWIFACLSTDIFSSRRAALYVLL